MAGLLASLRSWWAGGRGEPPGTSSPAFPDVRPPTPTDAGWARAPTSDLLRALAVPTFTAAQDVINALAMSEIAYTFTEQGPQAAVAALRSARSSFPPGLCTVGAIQATRPHVAHSYVLGSAPGALLVAFAGTQAARDVVADVDIRQTEVWLGGSVGGPAAVHRGFLERARGVPVALLASHAAAHGRRLVLCGHSLGGAVATMSALNLLRKEGEAGGSPPGQVSCVTFAAPALGNAALGSLVASRRWNGRFYNLTFPDDAVPRLLAATPTALAAADAAAQADKDAAPPPLPPGGAAISHEPFREEGTPSSSSKWTAWVPPVPSVPPAVARAAAAVGGALPSVVPSSWSAALPDMPSYAHFGQHHSPPVPVRGVVARVEEDEAGWAEEETTRLPPPTTGVVALQARLAALAAALPASVAALPDALTRVPGLAAHRVATYRDRVRTLVRGVPGAPRAWPEGMVVPPPPSLSDSVAPPLAMEAASARVPPLPPPPPQATGGGDASSYWATVRRTAADLAQRATGPRPGGGGAAGAAALSLTILVRGRGGGLASASGARVGLPPASWFPAAIRRRPLPGVVASSSETLTVVARVPAAALRAAAAKAPSSPSPLTLLLRSDCATARRPIALETPTAWLFSGGNTRLSISGEAIHNGVRYVRLSGGPAEAATRLQALEGGSCGLAGTVRRWWEGGVGQQPPSPLPEGWPDLVLALYDPTDAAGASEEEALRALAGRVRLVPVFLGGGGAAEGSAALARLYERVGMGSGALHVLRAGVGAAAPALVPAGLDGVVFRELMAAGGVARL